MRDLGRALVYLHSQGIYHHGPLTSAALLLTAGSRRGLLTGFGLSRFRQAGGVGVGAHLAWQAPEVFHTTSETTTDDPAAVDRAQSVEGAG